MSQFTDALNEQLAHEFAASQQYIAIAAWYDGETLPQLARHFYRQAVEERRSGRVAQRAAGRRRRALRGAAQLAGAPVSWCGCCG